MNTLPEKTAVIIIDHGSKRAAANDMLLEVVAQYKASTGNSMVEAAHMELAAPTLGDAVQSCINQGATCIVVNLFFLAPGRHSVLDIPAMVARMVAEHPTIRFHVTEPLGVSPQLAEVMEQRVLEALA